MRRKSRGLDSWWAVFAVFASTYALTAHWYGINNIDSIATAWPAWVFAHSGSFHLEDHVLPDVAWFIQSADGHTVSNRMAGVVLIGVPAQLLMLPLDVHPLTPSVLTAVLVTAAAVANLWLLVRRSTGDRCLAWAAALAVGLGTGLWPNASAELWTHGPAALWLSAAMLALQRERWWIAGVGLGAAVWTRPHLALVAAAVGLLLSARRRSLRPALVIGAVTGGSLFALVLWNAWLYGRATIGGGYSGRVAAATEVSTAAASDLLESAAGSLFSPLHGALVYSPVLVLMLLALLVGRRAISDWAGAAACGGALYQVAQWQVNGFTGGAGFYSYRLPLECIVLCTPAAVQAYTSWRSSTPKVAPWARTLAGLGVGLHAVGVFWYRPLGPRGQMPDPWRTWEPVYAVQERGALGTVVAVILLALVVVLARTRWNALTDGLRRARARTRALSAAAPS